MKRKILDVNEVLETLSKHGIDRIILRLNRRFYRAVIDLTLEKSRKVKKSKKILIDI